MNFDYGELEHLAGDWAITVLRYWAAHPEARAVLAVDCGMWEYLKSPGRRIAGDKNPRVQLSRWNPCRESYAAWSARLTNGIDNYLREEKRRNEAELEKYEAVAFKPENPLAFEWLALSTCCGFSDGKIALRYRDRKATRAAVKKARQRLAARLGVGTLDT